jgi:glutamate/tyrosine decarboxylase-like PLP-dependent enzyme
MNPNVWGGDQIANYVEAQVIQWFIEAFNFPSNSSGLLVSGGSMANLVGLTVARNSKSGFDIRTEGVHNAPSLLTIYGSTETHNSVQKAVELLGLGNKAYRRIPVNDSFQIDTEALETAIAEDRGRGLQPICIIGNAGTVNTGAVDDLDALANISSRENLWYHIDGAFGSLAALSPELRQHVDGLERADSLAFDLHKWMYMPFEIGCALVREEESHRKSFSVSTDYLEHTERGAGAGTHMFSDYGVQLSRGFRALKAWMSIKEYGIRKYGRLIKQNVEQAAYLSELIDTSDNLERLAPTSLNIVCFRFVADGMDEFLLNAINREILLRLHESGVAVPSYTTLKGKYALRVAITNHRSQRGDFDILVNEVEKIGQAIIEEKKLA